MAKRGTKTPEASSNPNPTDGVEQTQDEKGFTFFVQKRTDAWYRPDSGEAVIGALLGRREKKTLNKDGTVGAYFQVELLQSCKAVNADKENVTLEPGQIVGVDEKAGNAEASNWCTEGRPCIVYMKAIEKIQLDGPNTFWRWKIGRRAPRAGEPVAKPTMISRRATPQSAVDEDVPF